MKKIALFLSCILVFAACGNKPLTFHLIEADAGSIGCGDKLVEYEQAKISAGVDTQWMNALRHLASLDGGDIYENPLYNNIAFDDIIAFRTSADLSGAIDIKNVCNEARIRAILTELGEQLNFRFTIEL